MNESVSPKRRWSILLLEAFVPFFLFSASLNSNRTLILLAEVDLETGLTAPEHVLLLVIEQEQVGMTSGYLVGISIRGVELRVLDIVFRGYTD
jgi:hypothetical protein